MKPRLLFVGIDGGSHPLVSNAIDAGRLPTLEQLADEGASGVLRSTFPAHTGPAWTSAFTGVNPGEHGVFQFWETQSWDYRPRVLGANDWCAEPLWRTLERHGLTVGVLNVPMTHPPAKLDGGYMLSWPLSRTIHYAEPPELIRELAAVGAHYHSDIVSMYRGQLDYVELAEGFVRGRTKAVRHLLSERPVDALFVVYSEVDRVSHHFWGDREEPREEVLRSYELFDEALGELLELVSDDCLVAVGSDHGFGLCTGNLYVHELLETAGLCATKYVRETSHDDGPAAELDADESASWFTSGARYLRTMDWQRTLAFMPAPGCFGLNLNLRGRHRQGQVSPGAEAKAVRERLAEAVTTLFVDEAGEPLFDLVEREEVYRGSQVAKAPDLLLLPRRPDVMPHPGLPGEPWGRPTQEAIHREAGVVFLRGESVPVGAALSPARVEDVAPTLLALLGLPVQEGLDGKWLVGRDSPAIEPRQPYGGAPELREDDEHVLEDRLAAMGYI